MAEIEKINCTDSKIEALKKINAIIDNTADIDLSNLSAEGETKFNTKANTDFSNLTSAGQAKFDAKVSKSGDTMTGTLTCGVDSFYAMIAKSNIIDVTQTPSSKQYIGIDFRDKNDTRMGWIGIRHDAKDTRYMDFQATNVNKYLFTGPVDIAQKFGSEVAISSGWTAPNSGVIYVRAYSNSQGTKCEVFIDGWHVYNNYQGGSNANEHNIGATIPIYRGQKVTTGGTCPVLVFHPYV